jgi:hypothetical protein
MAATTEETIFVQACGWQLKSCISREAEVEIKIKSTEIKFYRVVKECTRYIDSNQVFTEE